MPTVIRPRVLFFCCLAAAMATAQTASKRPLNHRDYDAWKAISSQVLSRDGKKATASWWFGIW
jgi:hypothetical protein